MLSAHYSDQLIREILDAGVRGYIAKSDSDRDLVVAVEALANHKPFFTPRVSDVILRGLVGSLKIEGAHSMSNKPKDNDSEAGKPAVTLPGTVEKIIPPIHPSEPEKAQISVEGAEELYKEIRVENTLQDGKGAEVEVTIEADPEATEPNKHPRMKDQSTQMAKNKKAPN
jgi:hypothetical protein